MTFSYSGLTNYGTVTLPSVESWGNNMNILRDPPKSITTRKIDKVGDTSAMLEMINSGWDRICENILIYPRGINPSVSVSYNNEGSNGGIQAKLPYRIMDKGAFRPPVLRQENLLPLSRLPRVWTSHFSNPGFADFSRKMRTCGTASQTNEVTTNSLKVYIPPTATYKIEKGVTEPFETKYNIQHHINVGANFGRGNIDLTEQEVKVPTKEIDSNPLSVQAQTKQINSTRYLDQSNLNVKPYLKDHNYTSVVANVSRAKNEISIKDTLDLSNIPIKNYPKISCSSSINGVNKTNHIHKDIQLPRNIPQYKMNTNLNDRTMNKQQLSQNKIDLEHNRPMTKFFPYFIPKGNSDHSSRNVYMAPKLQLGGFQARGAIPQIHRSPYMNKAPLETEKSRISRIVLDTMQNRIDKRNPYQNS